MQEMTIRLPDETVNYLQRMDYEVAGLQVLHTHALNAGVALEKRMEIRREFQERYAEYQLVKNELWAEFAPKFPDCKRWWVDFQTGVLHVMEEANAVTDGNPPVIAHGSMTPPFNKGGTANCPPDNLPMAAPEVIHHA